MNSTDAEMIEAEAEAPAPPQALGLNSGSGDVVGNLLAMARQLVDQGKPSRALQAVVFALIENRLNATAVKMLVVMAMKIQGGDEAQALGGVVTETRFKLVLRLMSRRRCLLSVQLMRPCIFFNMVTLCDAQTNSILAETGRKQIMLDAFSDESSFICLQCGGLVSNHRKEEHCAFWC
ncbi:UNVERIFIED_CONTAM: hypothetical protein Sradi_3511900 [Sesamum radiatum]|uniref:C2HC zinc finger plants domain-containing protein n=1 Tax=Sesamum radiatum TaxID=300843 RepID=A0AAW2QG41_SESRA